MPALGRIKGTAFREFLQWYADTVDAERVRACVARASDAHGHLLDSDRRGYGIVASSWYEGALVHALLDDLTEGASERELARFAAEAAEHIMGVTLRGVYKALFSFAATPERWSKYSGKLWLQHYQDGESITEVRGPGHHHIRYVGWTGHHPFICRLNMAAAGPIYRSMGLHGVTVDRIGCVSDGAPLCEQGVRWRPKAH